MAKLESAGLDWLRLTTDSISIGERWLRYAQAISRLPGEIQDIEKRAQRLGYTGLSVPQLFVGQRKDGFMADMSGERARNIGHMFHAHGGKATRIDVQATFVMPGEVAAALQRAFEEACAHPNPRGHVTDVEMRVGRSGPRAVTIGRRSSEFYARIYDKWQESHEERYRDCLRYEVEVKGKAAMDLGELIRGSADKQPLLMRWLHAWFLSRGVIMPLVVSNPLVLRKTVRAVSTYESKRAWLRKQVAPTVRQVIERAGIVGALDDLLYNNPDGTELLAILDNVAMEWGR